MSMAIIAQALHLKILAAERSLARKLALHRTEAQAQGCEAASEILTCI